MGDGKLEFFAAGISSVIHPVSTNKIYKTISNLNK